MPGVDWTMDVATFVKGCHGIEDHKGAVPNLSLCKEMSPRFLQKAVQTSDFNRLCNLIDGAIFDEEIFKLE